MPTTRARARDARERLERETAATLDEIPHDAPINTQTSNARLRPQRRNLSSHSRTGMLDTPPLFTINLSLPPEQRYLAVCSALRHEIVNITSLFDDVVGDMIPWVPVAHLHTVCCLMLRGVYDREENRELKGISNATGVSMYLLVCFNVLLDLFMGCSSGGAAVSDGVGASKMVHFRTLDWGMPALRRIVVQLDFVTQAGGPVVASSVTYAGFVGVLTGVRQGLSVSLNFRPSHNDSDKLWSNMKYGWHLAMVLLGWRPSISTVLRSYLLPETEAGTKKTQLFSSKRQSGDGNGPTSHTTRSLTISRPRMRSETAESSKAQPAISASPPPRKLLS